MESMSVIDMGQVLAVLGLFYKLSADRAQHAEEMGRIKSQIEYLENKQNTVDTRLDNIDSKLEKLIASVVRLEALISHKNNYKYLETPKPQ